MIRSEISRETTPTTKGVVGEISYKVDYIDIDPYPQSGIGLPVPGEPWVSTSGVLIPNLRCVNGHCVRMPENPNLGIYTAYFSTEGQLADEYCETDMDIGLEAGPEMTGYNYSDTGTPVVGEIAPPIPVGTFTVKVRQTAPGYLVAMQTMNKVNDREFHGFPEGCVLFLGAGLQNSMAMDGTILSTAAVYKFSVKERAHKFFWRPPLQARDASYNLIFWQNIDNTQPFYTTDPNKIGTPVWINQVPGQETNPAGKGAWTPIEDPDGNPYFEEIDLADVLGIPGS